MSRFCKITGKRPLIGNHRSHAMNAKKRRFFPNLHSHYFWIESKKAFVKIRTSTKGLRIIDKKGINSIITQIKD
ncbi:MAG: 50S ribosomal protein L28 [Candidatus Dasytiphilus stammeri]